MKKIIICRKRRRFAVVCIPDYFGRVVRFKSVLVLIWESQKRLWFLLKYRIKYSLLLRILVSNYQLVLFLGDLSKMLYTLHFINTNLSRYITKKSSVITKDVIYTRENRYAVSVTWYLVSTGPKNYQKFQKIILSNLGQKTIRNSCPAKSNLHGGIIRSTGKIIVKSVCSWSLFMSSGIPSYITMS